MDSVWMYQFVSEDEDGRTESGLKRIGPSDMNATEFRDVLTGFLGQTNEAYVDKYDVIHEVYNGKDQPFAYYMDVKDNDWKSQSDILDKHLMNADANAREWLSEIKSAVSQKVAEFGSLKRRLPAGIDDNYDEPISDDKDYEVE